MKGYTMFGRTQLKDSDFQGMTRKQLETRFKSLNIRVVEMICEKYAKVEKKKPKTKQND